MKHDYCTVEREGRATIVTLNRPQSMNALHNDAHLELERVFDEFDADPDQWVAIITGAGDRAFCAGNDLKVTAAQAELTNDDSAKSGFAGLTSRVTNKPIIAAVNGVALGGGFEIALACDLVIASENASFGLPEPRVGLVALAGGVLRLPRQIGEKRALGMMLSSRRVSAKEGLELGFVNEVVPQGQAVAAAKRWAAQICEASPMSIRATKEAVRLGSEMPIERALQEQFAFPAMKALFKSDDVREGPRAFAEKRAPEWKSSET